ncbi:hypothetical protein PQO03_02765 [Lentisphaera profundi]|uniref:Zinc finger/thioredoxin putative domain-containing protein n=1 Tax=Lentisphaera profundi TaxID=1658616 RepID=A0ABY7VVN3_9BACT|nr:hypothetical protein [Lentisphaera profundi]WDE96881.1 hypothetical protein PQO03_02765 [Lentisphaera profundi]
MYQPTFECLHCRHNVNVTEDLLGNKINCPSCEQLIKIPKFLRIKEVEAELLNSERRPAVKKVPTKIKDDADTPPVKNESTTEYVKLIGLPLKKNNYIQLQSFIILALLSLGLYAAFSAQETILSFKSSSVKLVSFILIPLEIIESIYALKNKTFHVNESDEVRYSIELQKKGTTYLAIAILAILVIFGLAIRQTNMLND